MSNTASAAILEPLDITGSMIAAGTSVPVVDSADGESAYDPMFQYTGSESKVEHGGWLYASIAASKGVTPGTDTTKWRRTEPSNRMAPFDANSTTKAVGVGTMTYAVKPNFCNGIRLDGVECESLTVEFFESESATTPVLSWTSDMYEQAAGLFEYLFMPLRGISIWAKNDLPLYPDPLIKITLNSQPGRRVAIGSILVGFWQSLLGGGDFGGVEYGAQAEVKNYSTIKDNGDGTETVVVRASASNISASVVIEAEQANAAHDLIKRIGSKPVAFIASGLPRYDYLNTFGRISSTVTAEGWRHARLSISVRGYL